MSKLVSIASYTLSHEAHLVKSYLESEGIDVYINDDFMGSQAYLAPTGGVKLLVPGDQVVKAKHLLEEYQSSVHTVFCPSCGSDQVNENPWKLLSLGQKISKLLTGNSQFKCGNCGHEFKGS